MAEPGPSFSIACSSLLAAAVFGACAVETPPPAPDAEPPPVYVDRAADLGVDFVHFNGMSGGFLFPEMMGSGGALVDYDDDGDLDLYLVQGARLGPGEPLFPLPDSEPLTDRLYRNDPARPGAGPGGRFVDVTARAGTLAAGYGMGAATGDFDGDGRTDLYVTALGPNSLLRNRGDGTFEDVTRASGTGDDGWGVPALFFDFDDDGRSDLYVGNYVDYRVASDRACYDTTGARDYCGPTAYPAARDRLYRNLGDGRFAEVSANAGIDRPGRTLGAIAADLDGDGRLDLYVANDGEPNFLWLNRGGRFEDGAAIAGLAVDGEGRPQASMGVELADFDNDGDDDLLLTHLSGETNTLYRNEGGGRFVDASRTHRLAASSLEATGFGAAWLDYDLDGWLDLFIVNGAVKALEAQRRSGDPFPLKQPMQLLRNLGDGGFEDLGPRAGRAFERPTVGRGAAAGDLDGDGDPDVLVVNNNGAAAVLVNELRSASGWIGVDAPKAGFRVRLSYPEGQRAARGRTDGSYASARDPRVVLGLGGYDGPVELRLELGDRELLLPMAPTGRYLVFRP